MSELEEFVFWYYTKEGELEPLPEGCVLIRDNIVASDRELRLEELDKYNLWYHDRIKYKWFKEIYSLPIESRLAYRTKHDIPKIFYIKE